MKILFRILVLTSLLTLFTACPVEVATDYQAFMDAAPGRVLYLLNGSGETISGVDLDSGKIYNDLQILGHGSSSRAVPADILVRNDSLYVLLSGQNSIEKYSAVTLDYQDSCYLKNGFNPLNFIPVTGSDYVFVTGYLTDEIVLVNLAAMDKASTFLKGYEQADLSGAAHSETTVAATPTNAVGENKRRGTTGGAVYLNGTDSRLYVTNVRYDPTILLTDPVTGELVSFNGSDVRANGYYRQGTMSVFSFNAADPSNLALIGEIDLESHRTAAGLGGYFSGDGLNPQSILYRDGLLHVVCTGTNGGTTRTYTSSEYIPAGYSVGDEVPGTNPDDGIVLVLNPVPSPDNPVFVTTLAMGGSPAAFRESLDSVNQIAYLSGVGGVHSYRYGSTAGDFSIMHDSADPVIEADNPLADYYSHLLYDGVQDKLYASFFTGSEILAVGVTNPDTTPSYSSPLQIRTGDGPGAAAVWER